MAQKSGLNKFLEFIGLVDNEGPEQENSNRARYRDENEDAPRYTPRAPRGQQNGAPRAGRFGSPRGGDNRRPRPEPRRDAPRGNRGNELVRAEKRPMRSSNTTMVYYLHSLSECSAVIQDLIRGNSVLLNLEETDNALTQRIVDTLAGASFALRAKIRKVSEKMYLIAPENVEVNMTSSVERRY